jgi:capsule polysaccharide export protein KpsE/RkpR
MMPKNNPWPVIRPLYKRRRFIIGLTLIAMLLSVVISLSLPVYYTSETRFLAASPDLGKAVKIFGLTGTEMQYYGTEDDRDRLLSLADSDRLINFLIDSFDLRSYYGVDSTTAKISSNLQAALSSDLTIQKDERDAIRINMRHKDPLQAHDIVVAARNFIEKEVVDFQKQSQLRIINTFQNSIKDKKQLIQSYSDTLRNLRQTYGIIAPAVQSEMIATAITEAESNLAEARGRLNNLKNQRGVPRDSVRKVETRVEGLTAKINQLTGDSDDEKSFSNINRFSAGLPKFEYFTKLKEGMKSDISNEIRRLEFYRAAYTATPPGIHLIEEASVPDQKSEPVRSMIVIIATLGAFLFSLLWVWAVESYQRFDWDRLRTDG